METLISMDIALIGSVVLSWLAVGVALLSMHRMRRQFQLSQQLYARINHELQVTNSGSIGMGRRLIACERKLNSTASKQLQVETRDIEQLSYTHAMHLIDSGAGAEKVATSCGLSRAEASLMEMMHRNTKGAAAVLAGP